MKRVSGEEVEEWRSGRGSWWKREGAMDEEGSWDGRGGAREGRGKVVPG